MHLQPAAQARRTRRPKVSIPTPA